MKPVSRSISSARGTAVLVRREEYRAPTRRVTKEHPRREPRAESMAAMTAESCTDSERLMMEQEFVHCLASPSYLNCSLQ
jgi:hypothetical protein